jgi:hypothetical protein
MSFNDNSARRASFRVGDVTSTDVQANSVWPQAEADLIAVVFSYRPGVI